MWLKIEQEGLRRFLSTFPLTRVPCWYSHSHMSVRRSSRGTAPRGWRKSRSLELKVLGHGLEIGLGAPPMLDYFSGDWDVHWGYGLLTHGYT